MDTENTQSQSDTGVLDIRRETLANRWYDAIAPSVSGLDVSEVRAQLSEWTGQIITLLSMTSPSRPAAQAIGEALAREISSKASVIGKTQETLAQQITQALSEEQASALQPTLVMLLSEMATGFAQEQGKHIEKMRRKFLSSTSHDMRSPLNAVIGFSRIILKGVDGPVTDLQSQDLGTVYQSGKKLLDMVDNVFNIEKIEAHSVEVDPKTFELSDVIEEAAKEVMPLIEENENELEINTGDMPKEMHSDPDKVKQMLVYLLGHAAKFTKQGTVSLTASYLAAEGVEWTQFEISDTGLGMTPNQIQRFESVIDPDTLEYVEIELMVGQRLCRLLEGGMAVAGEANQGTNITLRLPIKISVE